MATDLAKLVVRLEAQTAQYDANLKKATAELRKFRQQTDRSLGGMTKSLKQFRSTFTASFQGLVAGLAAREIVQFSRSIAESADKVRLLSIRVQQFSGTASAFGRVYKSAQELGVGLEEAAAGMTRLLVVGRELGVTDKSAQRLYTTFAQLAKIGGSSGQEASAAFIQLTQALGAGALRGQELNSILEQAPLVAQSIAKELGVSVGELKKLGEEGKITSQVVFDALSSAAKYAREEFAKLPETLQMQQQRLNNAWTMALASLDSQLKQSEIWQFFTRKLVAALESYSGAVLDPSLLSDTQLTGEERSLRKRIMEAQAWIDSMRQQQRVMGQEDAVITRHIQERITLIRELEDRLNRVRIEMSAREAPEKTIVAKIGEDAAKAKNELKDLQSFLEKMRADAAPIEIGMTPIQTSEQQLQDDINSSLGKLRDFNVAVKDDFQQTMGEMSEFANQAARNMQDAFAQFFYDPFKDGLNGLVSGFIEAMRQVLANWMATQVAMKVGGWLDSLVSIGTAAAGAAWGGGGSRIPMRARGGPVSGGNPYIVGEKGPELFVPGMSGKIIPGGIGGTTVAPVYNIDARGATTDLVKALPAILAENNRRLMDSFRDARSRGAFA